MQKFAHTEVRAYQGVPTIFVEGQPLHGMTATSVSFSNPEVIRDFTAAGTEIMMIWIEAGIHCWKGKGEYDWSYAEKKLQLFEANSRATPSGSSACASGCSPVGGRMRIRPRFTTLPVPNRPASRSRAWRRAI